MEKGSELEKGHKDRTYKGGVVFLGDRVRDQHGNIAVFQELSSSPAALEAAKFCDAYGLLPGHECQQSDGEQAYIQSRLSGTNTWIRLPPHRRPASWQQVDDPVRPLLLALYGHPDSGGHWEKRCSKWVQKQGFKPVGHCYEWRSVFWHDRLKLMLVIYVDDFKMAGPKANFG
jgi:hypothetical protein